MTVKNPRVFSSTSLASLKRSYREYIRQSVFTFLIINAHAEKQGLWFPVIPQTLPLISPSFLGIIYALGVLFLHPHFSPGWLSKLPKRLQRVTQMGRNFHSSFPQVTLPWAMLGRLPIRLSRKPHSQGRSGLDAESSLSSCVQLMNKDYDTTVCIVWSGQCFFEKSIQWTTELIVLRF